MRDFGSPHGVPQATRRASARSFFTLHSVCRSSRHLDFPNLGVVRVWGVVEFDGVGVYVWFDLTRLAAGVDRAEKFRSETGDDCGPRRNASKSALASPDHTTNFRGVVLGCVDTSHTESRRI